MLCYKVDGRGLDSLQRVECPEPGEPGPGEVLVSVRGVTLNYRDLMVADGRYGGQEKSPIIAASDMAGDVMAVGAGVTEFKPGDRVLNAPFRCWPAGMLRSEWARTFVGGHGVDGVLAEKVLYPAESLVRIPTHLDYVEGASLTIAGLTAWAAVVTHGRVQPGNWVLLHGTGGVSCFGAQIAKMHGARTIMSTASREKGELVHQHLGVDAIIDYRESDWASKVRRITGGAGADIVVEVAGGASLGQSVKACGYGGRIGLIGVLAGLKSDINIVDMLSHQVMIRGIYMESVAELRSLARAFEAVKEHPRIDRIFPFAEAAEAYRYLYEGRHVGKVGISLDAP